MHVPDISFTEKILEIFNILYSLAYNDFTSNEVTIKINKTNDFFNDKTECKKSYDEFINSLQTLKDKNQYEYSSESTSTYSNLLDTIYIYFKKENQRLIEEILQISDDLKYVYKDNFIVRHELSDYWQLSEKIDNLAETIANNNFICSIIKGDGLIFKSATAVKSKNHISEEIKTLGASQRCLFPDLDKIAEALINEYSYNFVPPTKNIK